MAIEGECAGGGAAGTRAGVAIAQQNGRYAIIVPAGGAAQTQTARGGDEGNRASRPARADIYGPDVDHVAPGAESQVTGGAAAAGRAGIQVDRAGGDVIAAISQIKTGGA